MLYLLLGSDDFSKREFATELAAKHKLNIGNLPETDLDAAGLSRLAEASLFEAAKIWVIDGALATLDLQPHIEVLAKSANHIIFMESKLDKRKSATQALLKDKRIVAREFETPQGQALVDWITERFKKRGGKIDTQAVQLLANFVGGNNLWQVAQEVDKLKQYAGDDAINSATVEALVTPNIEVAVWDIVNALADKKPRELNDYLQRFLAAADGSDEKTKVIQLNALLAEQFRNVAMIQDFTARRVSDAAILEATAWKSGRVFVIKKIAQRFQPAKVLDCLRKLESLDMELKTGSVPPRVLLDMILTQVL